MRDGRGVLLVLQAAEALGTLAGRGGIGVDLREAVPHLRGFLLHVAGLAREAGDFELGTLLVRLLREERTLLVG